MGGIEGGSQTPARRRPSISGLPIRYSFSAMTPEPKEELSRPVLAVDSSTRSAWGSSSVNERAQVSQPHAATLGSGQDMPSAGGLSTALVENAALKEENERLRGLMKTALWELAALPKPQRNSEILRALPNSKHKEIEGQVQLKHGSFSAR